MSQSLNNHDRQAEVSRLKDHDLYSSLSIMEVLGAIPGGTFSPREMRRILIRLNRTAYRHFPEPDGKVFIVGSRIDVEAWKGWRWKEVWDLVL